MTKEIIIGSKDGIIRFDYNRMVEISKSEEPVKVIIPEGVTTIDQRAFSNFTNLVEVELPSTFKNFYNQAFYGCLDLKKINIPKKVDFIPFGCFADCINLKDVIFDKHSELNIISAGAFHNCVSLETTIPSIPVLGIDPRAFSVSLYPDVIAYIQYDVALECREINPRFTEIVEYTKEHPYIFDNDANNMHFMVEILKRINGLTNDEKNELITDYYVCGRSDCAVKYI